MVSVLSRASANVCRDTRSLRVTIVCRNVIVAVRKVAIVLRPMSVPVKRVMSSTNLELVLPHVLRAVQMACVRNQISAIALKAMRKFHRVDASQFVPLAVRMASAKHPINVSATGATYGRQITFVNPSASLPAKMVHVLLRIFVAAIKATFQIMIHATLFVKRHVRMADVWHQMNVLVFPAIK